MRNGFKGLALIGLVAVLVVTSVVSACGGGGGEKETNTILLGWLADQTGTSATAFKEVSKGIDDYLTEMEATNPIPGIKIDMTTYDTRLEYARFSQGYQWLVGQGMDVLLGYQPETPNSTLDYQAEDKIPQYNFSAYPKDQDADWLYGYTYSYQYEARAAMDYLVNVWWPAQGKTGAIKVAHVSNPEYGSKDEYQKGLDWVVAQNPGKVNLTFVGGGGSQTAWASEVASIMNTDALFISAVGTSCATFLKEAYAKGYKGEIVASTISVLGIWPMITSVVDKSKMDGMLIPHFYPLFSDDIEYSTYLSEMIQKYRGSEAESLKKGTTWMSGWVMAQILTETVRLAANTVGAKNVNGSAINDAFKALDITIGNMPEITLAARGGHHVLQPSCRMIQYKASADDWFAVTDWRIAPGFVT
jgi:ABC-type branched-subunit amino acid transport system substrate-binding protein